MPDITHPVNAVKHVDQECIKLHSVENKIYYIQREDTENTCRVWIKKDYLNCFIRGRPDYHDIWNILNLLTTAKCMDQETTGGDSDDPFSDTYSWPLPFSVYVADKILKRLFRKG